MQRKREPGLSEREGEGNDKGEENAKPQNEDVAHDFAEILRPMKAFKVIIQ